jgi:hypothetical protein
VAIRREMQHRASHLGHSMKAGLPPLWAAIAAALALVGGSVAITIAWGARHLYWGLILLLLIIVAVITEGSYQESKRAEVAHEAALEAQSKAHETELVGRSLGTETPGGYLRPCYLQREPYKLPNENMRHHRIGIWNPAVNPMATGVRLQWTGMSPRPQVDLGFPRWYPRQSQCWLAATHPSVSLCPQGKRSYGS